jgi:hypothetical protein
MTTLTLRCTGDVEIKSDNPDQIRGSKIYLHVSNGGGSVRNILFRFDLSLIPANAVIISASVTLFPYSDPDSASAYFERITSDWSESTATWNNPPAVTEDNRYTHNLATDSPFDVTQLLIDALLADDPFGFMIRYVPRAAWDGANFYSKEYGASTDPVLVVEYEEVPEIAFADVAISRRYGERLYLSGSIENIVESDEICVYYKRPGDTGIRNLKSDSYHWLQIWDVSGDCETPVLKRVEWLMNIVLPKFQYQLIFDLSDPDLGDNAWRLDAEYAKYEAAGSWFVNHDKPDCFTHIQPINTAEDDTPQSGWLSLGVEFGASPCAPLPYYLCPLPTPQTQYWRGECSCDLFKSTLQPLGIPCSHLIAAMNWYSGEPAWSDYTKCD